MEGPLVRVKPPNIVSVPPRSGELTIMSYYTTWDQPKNFDVHAACETNGTAPTLLVMFFPIVWLGKLSGGDIGRLLLPSSLKAI
jgi:hypothetical protein